ncbi:hypothetical protein AVEN_32902-1 [Araneus ventricosus]|uniref:Uncharacterized protein n=1 Tax=Araneus ventricosus TaxID=182803 RepID=A0A4Y2IKZ6_ARAVE|nr:hypothetical protein AVEN_32902-1 [Araneus ventricosus]
MIVRTTFGGDRTAAGDGYYVMASVSYCSRCHSDDLDDKAGLGILFSGSGYRASVVFRLGDSEDYVIALSGNKYVIFLIKLAIGYGGCRPTSTFTGQNLDFFCEDTSNSSICNPSTIIAELRNH